MAGTEREPGPADEPVVRLERLTGGWAQDEPIARAEEADSDELRLAAYHELRQLISCLKVPLDDPEVYPGAG